MGKLKMFAIIALVGCCFEGYPPEVKERFVRKCSSSNGEVAVCQCVIDTYEQQYSYAEYRRISQDMDEGKPPPPGFKGVVKDCHARYRR